MIVHDYIEKLAAQMNDHHLRLEAVVKELSDDEVREVVAECRREAQPSDSHNFAIPEWDLVADHLESELRMRHFFRRAAEHEAATGSTSYCLRCDGDCTPEHLAELDDE